MLVIPLFQSSTLVSCLYPGATRLALLGTCPWLSYCAPSALRDLSLRHKGDMVAITGIAAMVIDHPFRFDTFRFATRARIRHLRPIKAAMSPGLVRSRGYNPSCLRRRNLCNYKAHPQSPE